MGARLHSVPIAHLLISDISKYEGRTIMSPWGLIVTRSPHRLYPSPLGMRGMGSWGARGEGGGGIEGGAGAGGERTGVHALHVGRPVKPTHLAVDQRPRVWHSLDVVSREGSVSH